MMRTLLKSMVATVCLLALAVPASGQLPAFEIKLNPRIGLYAPLSNLGEADTGTAIETFELQNSLALGLGVELDFGGSIGVRANLDYATDSSVDIEDGSIGGQAPQATLLALVGDLMWRPLPRIVVLQPYLFAGGGLKQYDFDVDSSSSFSEESDPTIHLGGGLDFGIGPLALNAEISDYISWFQITEDDGDSEIQHDVFVTVGFSIGLL